MPSTDTLADVAPTARATLRDLDGIEGKAELIGGRIVHFMGSGDLPATVMFRIAMSLHAYAERRGVGVVYPDGVVYAQRPPLPGNERESFQPDASYHVGPRPRNRMRFIDGAPILAIEVRSENDHGRAAERDMADKRTDYFRAGTLVVWDVDPVAETIAVYRAETPTAPTTYRRGEVAEAEPATPGWRVAVDDLVA